MWRRADADGDAKTRKVEEDSVSCWQGCVSLSLSVFARLARAEWVRRVFLDPSACANRALMKPKRSASHRLNCLFPFRARGTDENPIVEQLFPIRVLISLEKHVINETEHKQRGSQPTRRQWFMRLPHLRAITSTAAVSC